MEILIGQVDPGHIPMSAGQNMRENSPANNGHLPDWGASKLGGKRVGSPLFILGSLPYVRCVAVCRSAWDPDVRPGNSVKRQDEVLRVLHVSSS